VEFTSHSRQKLTTSAMLARTAAALRSGDEDGPAFDDIPAVPAASLDFEAGVEEFQELARSAGARIMETMIQRRAKPDPATLIGMGKIEEIKAAIATHNAWVVIFDQDLSPSQLRLLDDHLDARVIDRTQLILDIFASHARTKEGQLQVELAQLEYQMPRLVKRGKTMSQLGGGIGTRGPGETKLETDRRRISQRIDHLNAQIDKVRLIRRQQRQRRESAPVATVALVGYTNAGKSTLFNALTKAGVLESSRMFATLDPKLHQLRLPSRRKILLSDTVGFIRNLPHTLVTSFRATLEEVERAELLLHVRDASSPMMDAQKSEVEKVLAELDVSKRPTIEVFNKVDLLSSTQRAALVHHAANADTAYVSGLTGENVHALLDRIDAALTNDPIERASLRIPQSEGAVLAAVKANAVVVESRFEGNLTHLTVRAPASFLGRYRRFLEK
jgi:GTP-binding protein HflX